jgi:sugar/nucleoside kinase (ribokinase family)
MIEATVAGHLCLDIIPRFESDRGSDLATYLTPGRLTEVGPATLYTGGPVSNAGINLHRLGIRTQLMGKIGDDLLGKAILDVVNSHGPGLTQGMIVVPGEHSSYTLVIDPPGVDRVFVHYPGTNDTFGAKDVRYELLSDTRLFHFGYPSLMARMYTGGGYELAEIFRRVKESGVTTSLDLAMPDPGGASGEADWPAILRRTLPHVDLFLPSVEELLFMLRRQRFDQLTAQVGAASVLSSLTVQEIVSLADEALAMGTKIVMLKAGTRGMYLRTATELSGLGRGAPKDLLAWTKCQLWSPSFRPDAVVSTVGTGDAAIAGFLAAILRDTLPALALKMAVAAGASCVESAGALGGVRTWAQTLARIEAGWDTLPVERMPVSWVWNDDTGIWRGPQDTV